VASVPVFLMALMTKETSAALSPLVIGLILRRSPPVRRRAAVAMVCIAAAFTCWRVLSHGELGPYEPSMGWGMVKRLGRYVCFPFCMGAGEPMSVLGGRWGWGIAGAALVGGMALLHDRGRAIRDAGVALLPLLPILPVDDVQGHYGYLAAAGGALVLEEAGAGFDASGGRRTWLRYAVRIGLMVWLGLHSRQCAEWQRDGGRIMR